MRHLISSPVNVAPRGAVVEELRAVDGVRLRAARWAPEGEPRGTVALFGGRGEFIEKHYETIGDLLQRNFASPRSTGAARAARSANSGTG